MKQVLLIFLLVFSPRISGRQISSSPTETDLKRLTAEKLLSCFDDWKVCNDQDTGDIADELARRGEIAPILERYWNEPNLYIRNGIERVAYKVNSPEVSEFMRQVLAKKVDDGENRYYPVNYLARKCDSQALKQLSSGRYRNEGSLQYETSVELFGKCKYRPAIPYLVGTALHDASFNIIIAAEHSLHALYPDAPQEFDELRTMQQYFCDRAHQDGFKVKCKADD